MFKYINFSSNKDGQLSSFYKWSINFSSNVVYIYKYYNYKKCLRWWIHSWRCDLGAVTNQVSWIETNLIKPNLNLVRAKKFNLIGPDHKDWIGLSPKQGVKELNPTTMLLDCWRPNIIKTHIMSLLSPNHGNLVNGAKMLANIFDYVNPEEDL